jgi:hypothetical protein
VKRTLDNCRLIKRHGKPEQDRENGICLGFGRGENDDEPCDTCKECKLNSTYDAEVRFWQNEGKGC